ncbi:hypothetical protein NM208_g7225 [Fusarium decemcellulare]|uniref:Uncharacterized protein n=1 Tax=Fusarium decemcellulare TaxID=57161 RepID=A0ACC1SA15_9HYPO|nr:hypothetical protein NM208_g7225 [Fusarium decemcellulare]
MAGEPPPVEHPQSYLDDNKGPVTIGLSITVCALSTITVAARLFTRQKWMGRLHLDDWLSLAAMLFEWAAVAGAVKAVQNGNGRHFDLLELKEQEGVIFWTILGFPFGLMALGLPKLAVSSLLMRLILPERVHRVLLWALPSFSMMNLLVCVALLYTRCLPTESLWNFAITEKKCYSEDVLVIFGIFTGAVCAVTDFYLALYPASVLWHLQMNVKKKIALSVALGIGSISAVFAITKCTRLPSLKSKDFSYDTADLIIWTVLEASSLIIASSHPNTAAPSSTPSSADARSHPPPRAKATGRIIPQVNTTTTSSSETEKLTHYSREVAGATLSSQHDGTSPPDAATDSRASHKSSHNPPPTKAKTEKELEKERKKAEKQAKFELKKAAQAQAAASNASKTKEKKEKTNNTEVVMPPFVEDTPIGERKRLKSFDDPYYSSYHPIAVESAWYAWWEKEGFFEPQFTPEGNVKPEGSFVIVVPPPNVTGALHMGHALGNSLQDLLIRYNRQKGKTTLWLPGCDHAGIATQSVVEKMLWKVRKQTRHDLGRTKFIELAQDWKEEYHQKINNAFRKMGCSLDWSREAFTMVRIKDYAMATILILSTQQDENFTAAVTEVFVRFHEEGIIYRANRLVNWDSTLMTALSNLEVDNKELTGRTLLNVPGYERKIEFGVIVHFKYPIENSDETIEIATTRLETMLGDSGIAVHPDDLRYTHLVGKFAIHPFIEGRRLPIVADKYVDREFGTGAVKLTPAHDPNDFNLGVSHKLEFINILTDDGLINENGGPYQGQKRFDVRHIIQEDLKKLGLYVDKKDNPMTVPLSERTKDVVEPIMKPQWWVNMSHLTADAVKAVESGEIKIKPESAEKNFLNWMANINDWCISRQLWWGHQCPVYYVRLEGEENDDSSDNRWFAGRTEEEALIKAKRAWPDKKFKLVRDEDVLDTWFSAGLWPFVTLGWPNDSPDLSRLFPTSLLETGWDIIPFWVARMIFFSIKLTGKVPFSEVFCHSLIRDSDGRKMSKSLGNVIDPLDVIRGIELEALHEKLLTGNLAPTEVKRATAYQKTAFPQGIPECGADALHFSLISYTTGGGDINFDVNVIHGYRRFCNKIWNASKYVLGKLETVKDFVPAKQRALSGDESLAELWILHKMNTAVKAVSEALEQRNFMKNVIFFIENSKALIQEGSEAQTNSTLQTLYSALEGALVLSHPFLPFITEELWQRLPRRPGDETKSVMVAKYPEWDQQFENLEAEAAYDIILGCSRGVRSLMAGYAPKDEAKIFIQAHDAASYRTVFEEKSSIRSLSGKGAMRIEIPSPGHARPIGCVAFPVSSAVSVFIHIKDRVDLDQEIAKATKKLEKSRAAVHKQRKLVTDPVYIQKVAVATQDADKQKLADLESEANGFEATIEQFKQLQLE